MRVQTLRRFVRNGVPAAGLSLLDVSGIALAQQNANPPQLKAVPEDVQNDPYLKSESGDKAPHNTRRPQPEDQSPTVEEWRDEAQKLLDSLGKMLKSIPTYETPTVDENGDIIIRRRPPADNERKPTSPPNSDGKTFGT